MPTEQKDLSEFVDQSGEFQGTEEQQKAREEAALVAKLERNLKHGRKHAEEYFARWADDRRAARGAAVKGEKVFDVRANLIGAIMEVLQAFLYAKNPDLSVRPSPSVGRARVADYRAYAETLEIIVSRLFHDARLKRNAKKWVRNAMTVGMSWLKCSMKTRKERSSIVEEEINDLQGQLERISSKELKGRDLDGDDLDANEEEIRANIEALNEKLERTVAEGLVFDVMAPEDVTISPECGDAENYLDSPWVAMDYYKTKDYAIALTGWKSDEELKRLETANIYSRRNRSGEVEEGKTDPAPGKWQMQTIDDPEAETTEGFYRFTEIWHKDDGVVYTLIDGVTEFFARKPYAPRTGSRFYPIFGLGFHYIDGELYPQSDVYQLKPMAREYDRTRSNYAEHRERAIPGIAFDAAAIKEESIQKLAGAQTQEYVPLNFVRPGTDIRTVLWAKVYNPVDPALYDTSTMLEEMEKVSGAQDAIQSAIRIEKTATEARIQEGGRGARNENRQDELEDTLTELSEYVVQLVAQLFDEADAERYAGPDAVWVNLSTDEALMMFNTSVKAGSTGKPKALSDREIWGTLLPLIEGIIDRIGQARVLGQEWAAQPWINLLEETFRRLDDPAEVSKFLPAPPEADPSDDAPSEAEEAEIELNRSRAFSERADAIEKVSTLMTREQATSLLLFGFGNTGEMMQPPQPQPPAVEDQL